MLHTSDFFSNSERPRSNRTRIWTPGCCQIDPHGGNFQRSELSKTTRRTSKTVQDGQTSRIARNKTQNRKRIQVRNLQRPAETYTQQHGTVTHSHRQTESRPTPLLMRTWSSSKEEVPQHICNTFCCSSCWDNFGSAQNWTEHGQQRPMWLADEPLTLCPATLLPRQVIPALGWTEWSSQERKWMTLSLDYTHSWLENWKYWMHTLSSLDSQLRKIQAEVEQCRVRIMNMLVGKLLATFEGCDRGLHHITILAFRMWLDI